MAIKTSKIENTDNVSASKIEKAYTDLVKVFNKYKLNVPEMLIAYGNLGYALGASIGGYEGKGPSSEELNKLYATNPTVDVALMISGLICCTWVDNLGQSVEKIKEEKSRIIL